MCPYAVSVTGTATTFVTAMTAVIKLDKISQGSYPTKKRASGALQQFYVQHIRANALCTTHVIQKTAETVHN